MTRMPEAIPEPPEGLILSPVANRTIEQAAEWYKEQFGLEVTTLWLKRQTDAGELHCQIWAGRRMYSTKELYRFLVTRPERTAGGKRYANCGRNYVEDQNG